MSGTSKSTRDDNYQRMRICDRFCVRYWKVHFLWIAFLSPLCVQGQNSIQFANDSCFYFYMQGSPHYLDVSMPTDILHTYISLDSACRSTQALRLRDNLSATTSADSLKLFLKDISRLIHYNGLLFEYVAGEQMRPEIHQQYKTSPSLLITRSYERYFELRGDSSTVYDYVSDGVVGIYEVVVGNVTENYWDVDHDMPFANQFDTVATVCAQCEVSRIFFGQSVPKNCYGYPYRENSDCVSMNWKRSTISPGMERRYFADSFHMETGGRYISFVFYWTSKNHETGKLRYSLAPYSKNGSMYTFRVMNGTVNNPDHLLGLGSTVRYEEFVAHLEMMLARSL